MKPVCLGKKNYLFYSSEQVTKNMSLIYSIIENRLHLVEYIADILRKLVSSDADYMAILPMNIDNNLIINRKYNSMWAIIPLQGLQPYSECFLWTQSYITSILWRTEKCGPHFILNHYLQ